MQYVLIDFSSYSLDLLYRINIEVFIISRQAGCVVCSSFRLPVRISHLFSCPAAFSSGEIMVLSERIIMPVAGHTNEVQLISPL